MPGEVAARGATAAAVSGRRVGHALEYAGFRAARSVGRLLPEGLVLRVAAVLGWIAGAALRVRRRDVDRHLALAFPDRSRRWRRRVARASYVHLAREAATVFRMAGWGPERILARVSVRGLSELRQATQEATGALLLTGHIGNWELAGSAVAAAGVPLDVVGKGMANRRFEADLFQTREQLGMRVIDMTAAHKGVLRALREGRVVAMLADQNAHRSGVFVPFFGKAAATARGPALFAIRTGAPVFLGISVREPGWRQRYTVTLTRMSFRPTGDVEADTRALLTEYAAALEAAIREAPGQYFWQHKRWKTRPPGEPASPR